MLRRPDTPAILDSTASAKWESDWRFELPIKRRRGQATRTIFLLKQISDSELISTINAATNKSKQFNEFIKWIRFCADGVIHENDRDEQRKFIRYNQLVSNC